MFELLMEVFTSVTEYRVTWFAMASVLLILAFITRDGTMKLVYGLIAMFTVTGSFVYSSNVITNGYNMPYAVLGGLTFLLIPIGFMASKQLSRQNKQRRQARILSKRLAEEDGVLDEIFRCAPISCVVIKEDGEVTHANEKFAQTLGYRVDQLIGMNVDDLLPEEYRGGHIAKVAKFMRGESGSSAYRPVKALTKKGQVLNINLSIGTVEIFDITGGSYTRGIGYLQVRE